MANRADDVEAARVVAPGTSAADPRAEAFRHLVGTELERSYRLAAVILGDRFEAEDAVHDAAVSAWSRWVDLRDPARFQAWFGRILVNECRDRLRRRRRRIVEVIRAPLPAEHPRVSDDAESHALRDLVGRTLERLSADERLVVVLRYEADLTVPEIGRLAGIPGGTVKSRLHGALAKLRAALEEADR